ncbi:MAG: hypothetical protein DCF22_15570 [Leptolyngbya sp.]|nr:MAG: hypothetical protein DCF22_15570 [Leptolyngbya sp.]
MREIYCINAILPRLVVLVEWFQQTTALVMWMFNSHLSFVNVGASCVILWTNWLVVYRLLVLVSLLADRLWWQSRIKAI